MCNSWCLVLHMHGTCKKRAWHSGEFKICSNDCAMTQRDKEATVSCMSFGVMIYYHEVHWQDCSAPLYPRTVKKTSSGDWHALGSMSKGFCQSRKMAGKRRNMLFDTVPRDKESIPASCFCPVDTWVRNKLWRNYLRSWNLNSKKKMTVST